MGRLALLASFSTTWILPACQDPAEASASAGPIAVVSAPTVTGGARAPAPTPPALGAAEPRGGEAGQQSDQRPARLRRSAAPAPSCDTLPAAAPARDDEARWRARLTPEQYRILREGGTERAFSGRWLNEHRDGSFRCAACGVVLFDSDDKFDSGTGWPSFTRPAQPGRVATRVDTSHGMVRTEVRCPRCGSHLGHVFEDGPAPTGLRYCINSASLDFAPSGGEP